MHARELQHFNFYSLRIQDLCLVKQNNLQMVSAIVRPYSHPCREALAIVCILTFYNEFDWINLYFLVKYVMHFLNGMFAKIGLIMYIDLVCCRHRVMIIYLSVPP
jgi:ABC-type protease/lipase transport system fused ATPase/permease subunit